MARLTKADIQQEVEEKGFELISAEKYENLESDITIACKKGHNIITNLKTVRRNGFECPICASDSFKMEKPRGVPEKDGYRVIAFDNATEKMGVSIYDDGRLVYYNTFVFVDPLLIQRLVKIQRMVEEVVIDVWKPDFIVFEDVQEQGPNVKTFKVLSMLLGVLQTTAAKKGVEFDCVLAKVWRSGVGVLGRTRQEQKANAIQKVRELTGQIVAEDAAEAILIGKYASTRHRKKLF